MTDGHYVKLYCVHSFGYSIVDAPKAWQMAIQQGAHEEMANNRFELLFIYSANCNIHH